MQGWMSISEGLGRSFEFLRRQHRSMALSATKQYWYTLPRISGGRRKKGNVKKRSGWVSHPSCLSQHNSTGLGGYEECLHHDSWHTVDLCWSRTFLRCFKVTISLLLSTGSTYVETTMSAKAFVVQGKVKETLTWFEWDLYGNRIDGRATTFCVY